MNYLKNYGWYLLFLCLIACKTEEIHLTDNISDNLQLIIANENVTAVHICCVGCQCFPLFVDGSDYEFVEDHFIRVEETSYNLNRLLNYQIINYAYRDGDKVDSSPRMLLFFSE